MNTRHASRWFWTVLGVVCLTFPFFANKAATQSQDATANVKTADGLTVVTFTANPGTIKVNLPDDMMAGDTISGTVICEPKGNTKEERGANQSELNKLGIKLIGRPETKPEEVSCGDVAVPLKGVLFQDDTRAPLSLVVALFVKLGNTLAQASIPVPTHPSGAVITPDPKITPPGMTPSGAVITPDPKITTPPGMTPSGAVITPDPKITPPGMTPSGAVITPDPKITTPPGMTPSGAVITPDPKITVPTHPSGAVITPDPKITTPFSFPPVGQAGRPIWVAGPFDGNSSNTRIDWGSPGISVGGEDRESMGLYSGPIAESPRRAVFQSPTTFTGPTEVTLKEANTETKSQYRNVGIKLTAPKTDLLKGEQTELRVEVNGLEGLKQPVPLTITYGGVIVMEGGQYQPLMIQPSQVGADGRYTTTRGITGVQTGGWTATATVVTSRFDFCLQDDSVPARVVLWNTFTGDYSFSCPGCFPPKGQQGGMAGGTGKSGGTRTGGTTQGGGTTTTAGPTGTPGSNPVPPTGLTGTGTMTRKGCILTLTHNAPDRRVFSSLDVCTNSGSSTVEVPKTDRKFTITDRNTADNTCACGPGCK